ncbi:MAG: type III pantothenate kinase [Endozoicomonas sp.]
MKILDMDAGNTRLKWRLLRGGEVTDAGFIANSESWSEALPGLLDRCGAIDAARASIVSGNCRLDSLKNLIRQCSGVELQVARTQKSHGAVRVAYTDAERLGVDRWLTLLAAHELGGDCHKMIVDCGTAMTVDVLDSQGLHQGGYIVPGLRLMKGALAVNTADLDIVEHSAHATDLGTVTEDCINHGVLAMAVALVNSVQNRNAGSRVFLTGGDAPRLLPHINSYIEGRVIHVPDLVLDGLAIAFRRST